MKKGLIEKYVGKKYGLLTILDIWVRSNTKGRVWCHYQCDCGRSGTAEVANLKNIKSRCCQNLLNDKWPDLTGRKVGKLSVVEFLKKKKDNGRRLWLCQCDCGNLAEIEAVGIMSNLVQSCGCLKRLIGKEHQSWKGHQDISGVYFGGLKTGARKRNLEFNITIEQVWNLFLKQDKKCAYTKIELYFSKSRVKYGLGTASLDRIDSTKGYILDNVQWIHKDLQRMKMDFSHEEFINYCKLIAKNN